MLTIIFGAGASYDSAPVNSSNQAKKDQWRPPLTKDLFLPEKVWFQAHRLPTRLIPVIERIRRDARSNNLEYALEELKREMDFNPSRWEQILAIQEWLCDVLTSCSKNWIQPLGSATTYVDLLSRLYDWQIRNYKPINLITFNYDNLLEKAAYICFKKQIGLNNFESYLTGDINIFKPHGSIDWWWEILGDKDRKYFGDYPLSENEKKLAKLCIGPRSEGTRIVNNTDVYYSMPAIAIPVISKSHSDFVFPPGHEKQMHSALDSTEAIIVIGWAAAEEHFMSEFSKRVKKNVPVLVVCGEGGDRTAELLRSSVGLEVTVLQYGFSDFLDTTNLENWLDKLGKH